MELAICKICGYASFKNEFMFFSHKKNLSYRCLDQQSCQLRKQNPHWGDSNDMGCSYPSQPNPNE